MKTGPISASVDTAVVEHLRPIALSFITSLLL